MNLLPLTGFPRSGSTLLLYLLNQNPIFTIGPDSEISNLLNWNKEFIEENIYHFQLPHEKVSDCFIDFCRKGTKAWINQICPSDKIFIDKSRHWLKNLDYNFKLFPEIKIIILIRDLRGVANSFEKINNNSLFVNKQNIQKNLDFDLQLQRVQYIFNLSYIKDAAFTLKELIDIPKSYSDRILFCRYEDLILYPENELKKIYKFLDLPKYNHDLNNIQQEVYFDNSYQPYGCHKIQNKISKNYDIHNFSELREDIQEIILNENQWYYKKYYPEVKF